MSAALYPKVAESFFAFRDVNGPVSKLDTRIFLVGPKNREEFNVEIEHGKTLIIKSLGVSPDVNDDGEREVSFMLNGQERNHYVRDHKLASELNVKPKADPTIAGQVGAPMKGDVIDVKVKVGDKIEKGKVVAVLSAMKMEMAVQATKSGVVKQVLITKGEKVEGDDFMIEIE